MNLEDQIYFAKKERNELLQRIELYQDWKSLTDNFAEQMMYADEIHKIKMKLNGVKPTDSAIDCIGCGS
tara:strand:- start:960 stop:1166 length:207 start_codon:yes stop_codon:yes gene_type:complete